MWYDFFSFSLRSAEDRAAIDALRATVAAQLGVSIGGSPVPMVPTVTPAPTPAPTISIPATPVPTSAPVEPTTPAPIPAVGDTVTLDELAALAISSGLTLADFDNTFGAGSLDELLSRTSTTRIGFNDNFSFALRSEMSSDMIDLLREGVAEQLGVTIGSPGPILPPFVPEGERETIPLDDLPFLARDAGFTLDDFPETFEAVDVVELLRRTDTTPRRLNDNFRFALEDSNDRAVIDELRQATAAQLGVNINV